MNTPKFQQLMKILESMKEDVVTSNAFLDKLRNDAKFQVLMFSTYDWRLFLNEELSRDQAVLDSIVYFQKSQAVDTLTSLSLDEEKLSGVFKFYSRMYEIYKDHQKSRFWW